MEKRTAREHPQGKALWTGEEESASAVAGLHGWVGWRSDLMVVLHPVSWAAVHHGGVRSQSPQSNMTVACARRRCGVLYVRGAVATHHGESSASYLRITITDWWFIKT